MKKQISCVYEYLLSFLLLVLNLVNYETRLNSALFFGAGTVLFCALFALCFSRTKNMPAACLMMFCHTWQISWFNILGAPTAALQLPWFYIIGAILVVYALANIKKIYTAPVNPFFLVLIFVIYILSTIPLLLSPSKTEGLKEYIMILFYVTLMAVAFFISESVDKKNRELILDAYSWCVFITCLFLIIQAVLIEFFGISLFYHSEGVYFGNATSTVGLLMGDLSSASIMLGSAVFIYLYRIENKRLIFLNAAMLIVTVIGMALTSRRTGMVTLIAILALYAFTHYKGVLKKILSLSLFSLVVAIMLFYLLYSRPVDDLSLYLYDNQRFENYFKVLTTLLTHPFGVGFDTVYANTFMVDNVAPHNTYLRWALMGGPLFSITLCAVPLYALVRASKKKLTAEKWILIYSLVAANIIPDILTARFFVIPCICAIILTKDDEPENKNFKRSLKPLPIKKNKKP